MRLLRILNPPEKNDLQVYGSPIIQTGGFHFQPGAAPVDSMVLVTGL